MKCGELICLVAMAQYVGRFEIEMMIYQLFWRVTLAIALLLFFVGPTPCVALEWTGADDLEQSAILFSPQPDKPIPIALRPAPNQPNVGYGISGHSVTVLEQVGDYLDFDDPSATWCHIRLDDKPFTEGWVQGRSLTMPSQQSP